MSPDRPDKENPGDVIARFIDRRLATNRQTPHSPAIVGLCGAQGIGKSTLCRRLVGDLAKRGYRTLVIGLDDLYLPRSKRQELGRTVHPLLQTRGVPGTHEVELGLSLLLEARGEAPMLLPIFDKAIDDRLARNRWHKADPCPDIILLEGWCVGAAPQDPEELARPINQLEQNEDPDAVWRGYVNAQLAGPYQRLFDQLDMLILLAAPSFEIVAAWRGQQEEQMLDELAPGRDAAHAMSKAEVDRFVLYYERLTRHILSEMPGRADLVLRLDEERQLIGTEQRL